ncbi:hypothetical protein [Afipia sp. Root123D2]|uniref:hypothetical protein n=1 Tax=Afipia sp. Root123D2 TaxID=1736436 RepID=UPI000A932CB6|nr:hypothetical protein [Afipia sp. Root123D2]
MNSKEPANTIEVGDAVKVGRGTWGLKEWYPGRSFKVKLEDKGEETKEIAH